MQIEDGDGEEMRFSSISLLIVHILSQTIIK